MKLDPKCAQAGVIPTVDLPQNVTPAPLSAAEGAQSSQASEDAASATSSEESFELIGTTDIAEHDATNTEAEPALADLPDEESATFDPAVGDIKISSSDDVVYQ